MNLGAKLLCSKCGADFSEAAYCPYCGSPTNAFFADNIIVESCRQSLMKMAEELSNIPPAPGWKILLLWFCTPILVFLLIGLLIQKGVAWATGLATGVVLFFLLTPLIASMLGKVRKQQAEMVIGTQLNELLKDERIQKKNLYLLAKQDEHLKNSLVMDILK